MINNTSNKNDRIPTVEAQPETVSLESPRQHVSNLGVQKITDSRPLKLIEHLVWVERDDL